MKSYFVHLSMLLFFLTGCSSNSQYVNNEEFVTGDNSRTSLDWQGKYKGILPCADCEGIETTIMLNDSSFAQYSKYIGKSEEVFKEEGAFEWDDRGFIITLNFNNGEKQLYHVGEDKLFMLDNEGNKITGQLAEKYILHKTED